MKRKTALFLLLLLMVGIVRAERISERRAEQIAQQMMESFGRAGKADGKKAARRSAKPRLVYTAKSKDKDEPNLYVYNNGDNGGFVIVAGDNCAVSSVLGYSDQGTFDYDKAPENLRSLLDLYASQIEEARATKLSVPQMVLRRAEQGNVVVGPLLTTTWNQGAPFNNLCPDPDEKGQHCLAGCVPIAMAQVMRYHKWPERGHNKNGYYYWLYMEDLNAIDKHKWIEVDFYQSVYDWDNMPDNFSYAATDTQRDAVARLVYDCGVASEAKYGYDATPAYMYKVEEALRKFFSYKAPGLRTVTMENEQENFDVLLKEELDNHRPALMAGYPDGYDDADYFHFNFGWGGLYDGYFRSSAITLNKPGIIVDGGPNFTKGVYAIIGIQPNNPDAHDVDGLVYELQEGGEARLLYGKNPGDLNIPSEIEVDGKTYLVTSIAPYAFYERTDITNIYLPTYLREVDDYAFYGCSANNEIYLPQRWSDDGSHLIGIERVGDYGFAAGTYASSMKTFGLVPSTLTEIGEGAFAQSRHTGTLQLFHMKKIGDKAFYGASINRLVIAGDVREIGKQAFQESSIQEIDFQPSVSKIGDNAFDYCKKMGNGVLYLPNSVGEIGREAFRVAHLKEIHLPKHVWSIGENALQIIPVNGFSSTDGETASIFVDENNSNFSSRDGMLFNKHKTRLITCPPSMADVSIPRVTSEVDADAFYHAYVTTTLTIPSSVKSFGNNSFVHVASLKEVYNYALEPQPLPGSYARFSYYEPLTVHVLRGKKELFEAAEGWRELTIVDDLMDVDDRVYTVLTVYTKDGGQHEIQLFDKPEVTFESGNLCIRTNKKEVSFPLADVHHYNFEKGYFDAIEDVNAAEGGLAYHDSEVSITHLPEGTSVSVYALDGKKMLSTTVPASGICSISLRAFPTGVYVVKANDITYKILKR